jgi:hypothetical protein
VKCLRFVLCLVMFSAGALLAESTEPLSRHDRVIYIVPLTGAGTTADPIRPAVIPKTGFGSAQALSWSWQPSDDGKMALVEVTATQHSAFDEVLKDKRIIKSFERSKQTKDEVETQLKIYKKDFKVAGREAKQP